MIRDLSNFSDGSSILEQISFPHMAKPSDYFPAAVQKELDSREASELKTRMLVDLSLTKSIAVRP